MKELGDESVFWEEGTVCAKAWKQLLSGGRLKELSTVRVGRRKGTGTVLPAGWSLEAGPMDPPRWPGGDPETWKEPGLR
ncbi:hypothetical protein DBR06_SOUSAS110513, partial [Sousa chinensis]